MLKLAALESTKNLDLEKKEGRIDDLLRVRKIFYCLMPCRKAQLCLIHDFTLLKNKFDYFWFGYRTDLNLFHLSTI